MTRADNHLRLRRLEPGTVAPAPAVATSRPEALVAAPLTTPEVRSAHRVVSLSTAEILEAAGRQPFSPENLIATLSRVPAFAAAYAAKNGTGESLAAHTLAVMSTFESILDAHPELATLVAPHRALARIAMALHDIGKPSAIAVDGHSRNQKQHTQGLIARHLPGAGFSANDIELISNLALFDISDGQSCDYRPRFDVEGNRQRLRSFVETVPHCSPGALLAMALVFWMSDASAYPALRAASFVGNGGEMRLRGDEPARKLLPLLGELAPAVSFGNLFAAADAAETLPEAALERRWCDRGSREFGFHFGYRLTLGAGGVVMTVSKTLQRLMDEGVTRRIGVDLERPGADWRAIKPKLEAALAGLSATEARATLVCVRAHDSEVLSDVRDLTRAHDVGSMLIADVDLLSPERRRPLPRFDAFWFDDSSNPDARRDVLRAIIYDVGDGYVL